MKKYFEVVSARAFGLKPDDALKLLKNNTYEAQRDTKDRHIDELIEEINNGLWRSAEISIGIMPSGEEILVNGQHTLMACTMAEKEIFAFVIKYKVAGKKGLSVLYKTFDLGRGGRSIGDAIKAEMYGSDINWPIRHARLISTAAAFIESDSFRPRFGKAAQSRLINKYKREGQFIVSLCIGKSKAYRHLMRAPIITAMIATWREDKEAAVIFWSSVRDGFDLPSGAPAEILKRYLSGQPETWDRKALYSKCIYAFNCFIESKERIKLIYHAEAETIKPIGYETKSP